MQRRPPSTTSQHTLFPVTPLFRDQHRYRRQVAGAERAIEPVGVAKATGKVAQPDADAVLEGTQALLVPGLVALEDLDEVAVEDRRLHRVERGKHPCDRACPGIGDRKSTRLNSSH